jgi:hypothetical protein
MRYFDWRFKGIFVGNEKSGVLRAAKVGPRPQFTFVLEFSDVPGDIENVEILRFELPKRDPMDLCKYYPKAQHETFKGLDSDFFY